MEGLTLKEEIDLLSPQSAGKHIGRDRLAHIRACRLCQQRIIAALKTDRAVGTIVMELDR